ncbi:unnamed protein product [Arctogadus glacialis]
MKPIATQSCNRRTGQEDENWCLQQENWCEHAQEGFEPPGLRQGEAQCGHTAHGCRRHTSATMGRKEISCSWKKSTNNIKEVFDFKGKMGA